jgi:membrane-associated phospholipid phosphatase
MGTRPRGDPRSRAQATFAVPERAVWFPLAVLCGGFAALFEIVYFAGNRVAELAPVRLHVDLPFEASIPFVPWAILVYLTITPFLLLAPFIFRTPRALLPLFAALCAEVLIGGAIFCLFPVELSFPSHHLQGVIGVLFRITNAVNLTYNCVPSLHVAFAISAAWAYSIAAPRRWRLFVWAWALAVVVSTIVTHQHHVADVVAGAVLSWSAMSVLYPRVPQWTLNTGFSGLRA